MLLRKRLLLLLISALTSFPAFAYENFNDGNWQKGGADSGDVDLGVTTSTKVIITNSADDEESYIYLDKGYGGIGTSFTYNFEYYITGSDDNSEEVLIFSVSNTSYPTWQDLSNSYDGVGIVYDDWGGVSTSNSISIWDFENGTEDDIRYYTPKTTIQYCTIVRDSSTYNLYVFSDSARTNLLYSLSATVSTNTYQYLSFWGSRYDYPPNTEAVSLYINNVDLSGSLTDWTSGEWGANLTAGLGTNVNFCRCMGGTSPSLPSGASGMKITGIGVYGGETSGTDDARFAIYTGGALDNPTNASLLVDIGVLSGDDFGTDYVYDLTTPVDWSENTITWVCFKDNDSNFGFNYLDNSKGAGDYQTARGRYNVAGESTDETDAWDDPMATTGGSFANYWYALYVEYSVQYPSGSERRIWYVN